MKLLASVFLLYFSSLIAQPMVTLVHGKLAKEKPVCTMTCCQHHKQANKQTKSAPFGCCNNDMSNPFAQYSCCVGFIPGQQNGEVAISIKKTVRGFINTGVLIPNYCSDCWRPPKLTV